MTIANFPTQTITPHDYQGSIFAKTDFSSPLTGFGKNKTAIGWDWLQYSGICDIETSLTGLQDLFKWQEIKGGNEHFAQKYQVSVRVDRTEEIYEPCAWLFMVPRVSFIPADICQIKIENKYCYQGNPVDFIKLLNDALGIKFKNYTRLDAFMDFQAINYDGSAEKLMLDFSAKKVVMKSKTMVVHHDRNKVTGITWGKRISGMSVTMYNKSLHMRKRGNNKPWVCELWQQCGFASQINTYRLEFSQKKNLNDLIDEGSGEWLGNHSDINYITQLDKYIKWAYNNHFKIAKFTSGVRFSRMDRINIIDMDQCFVKSIRLTDKEKSTNYIKCQIKNTVTDAMEYQAKGEEILCSTLLQYVQDLVTRYYLEEWFQQKFAQLEIVNTGITIFDMLGAKFEYLSSMHEIKAVNCVVINNN